MSVERTLCQYGVWDDSESEKNVIATLERFSDAYYNEEPKVEDNVFDELYKFAKEKYPTNGYFRQVGSAVRGAEIKHNMPVAGLEQLYTIDEVVNWGKEGGLAVASAKLDGGSGTITYVNGKLISAATRGDGIYGKDITRHIINFPGVPNNIRVQETLDIRGEIIISKANFPIVQELLFKIKGRKYKNARNTLIGLINGSEISEEVFPYLDFVAYDIAGSELNKDEQFWELERLGFKVPKWRNEIELGLTIEEYQEQLDLLMKELKDDNEYECDGIVIELWYGKRRKELMPTEDNLTPQFAFKWKVNGEESMRTSTCTGIEWNISKDNYIKPVVLIEPVDLGGVTIKRLSGFNMAFITDNMISTGAIIKFCRSGDVIPHIVGVIEKAITLDLPDIEWEWSEKEVDAIAVEDTPRAHLLKTKDFFNGLKVDNLQEASIEKLIDAGYDSIQKIIELTEDELIEVLGKNGSKAFQSLHKVLSDCDLATLMGSYPSFGRGFGKRKAKALIDGVSDWITAVHEDIIKVEGYSDKSAITFLVGRDNFLEFYHHLIANNYLKVKVKEEITGILSGISFAFTGIRSKEAEDKIIAQGGIVHDGVKKDTTYLVAKDTKASSGKLDKARKQGTKVVSLVELNDIIDPTV